VGFFFLVGGGGCCYSTAVLVALVLLLAEGIGLGWRWSAAARLQWCSSCWCFSSGEASAWLAMGDCGKGAVVIVVLVLSLVEASA
jgi:hypothetical protein